MGFDWAKNPFWWPGFGTVEIIPSAVLAQNTKFENVLKSLSNLKSAGADSLEMISNLNIEALAALVKPSGFQNVKAKRLQGLCKAILGDFGDFETFKQSVSREWLANQKGVGCETCDAILCYGCEREIMVCDRYTARLLAYLGYEFESYDETREWLEGIAREAVWAKYPGMSENEMFARYHGLIVEFCKAHLRKGGEFDEAGREILSNLK